MAGFALSRYERQIDIPEIGMEGQKKLFQSSALVIGMGGLGCPAALYLAAAGIGRIGLFDGDTVSLSNLQRQILFTEQDVNAPKVDIAAARLRALSSASDIKTYPYFLTAENGAEVIAEYDVILDCTDNFDTRYLVNKLSFGHRKKLVSASLYHHDGQLSVFNGEGREDKPCYQCLYPQTDDLHLAPNCSEAGILGPVAGILGTMQAVTAINELLGIGETLAGSMLVFNSLSFTAEKIRTRKNPDCPVCSGASKGDFSMQTSCSV